MDDRCPKCDAEKIGESCPKCGLVYAKFKASVLEEGTPEEIKSLWGNTLKNWENESAHAIFIEKALNAGAGGYAASCYRKHGVDDQITKKQLEKIGKRLEQMMLQNAAPRAREHSTFRLVGILVLVLAFLGLALYVLTFYSPARMQ